MTAHLPNKREISLNLMGNYKRLRAIQVNIARNSPKHVAKM